MLLLLLVVFGVLGGAVALNSSTIVCARAHAHVLINSKINRSSSSTDCNTEVSSRRMYLIIILLDVYLALIFSFMLDRPRKVE